MRIIQTLRTRAVESLGRVLSNHTSESSSAILGNLLILLRSFNFYAITDIDKVLTIWNLMRKNQNLTQVVFDVTGDVREALLDNGRAFQCGQNETGARNYTWNTLSSDLATSLVVLRQPTEHGSDKTIFNSVNGDILTSPEKIESILKDNPWLVTLLLLQRAPFKEIKAAVDDLSTGIRRNNLAERNRD